MTVGLADAIRDEIRRGDLEARARHRQADAAARRQRETVSGEGGAEGTPPSETVSTGQPETSGEEPSP